MTTFPQRAKKLRLEYEVVTGIKPPYPGSKIKFEELSASLNNYKSGTHDSYIEKLKQI